MKDDKNLQDESERILRRAEQESHGVFTGALHRIGQSLGQNLGKMSGLSAGENVTNSDPVEKWGRIIGRTLGFLFLAVLAVNLFTGWFF